MFDSYKVLDWSDQITSAISSGSAIDDYRELSMSSKCMAVGLFGPLGSTISRITSFLLSLEAAIPIIQTDYPVYSPRNVP